MSRSRGKSVGSVLRMRSLGSAGVLAVAAFYVAWPLYAGHEIKTSLDGQNVDGLNARIDFPSVRVSLRPAVTAQVDKVFSDALRRAGTAGGVLGDKLKASVTPRIVDSVLATLVTPDMLIRIHASGRTLKEVLQGLVLERAGQTQELGGFMVLPQEGTGADGTGGSMDDIARSLGIDAGEVLAGTGVVAGDGAVPAPVEPLPAKGGQKPHYGLGNITHFSFTGPLGLSLGLARDAAARKPDLTAELTFVDGTWKLTGLVPGT